eukprot:scaffold26707_cov65-Phaeocystis_antarctica.AAC.2
MLVARGADLPTAAEDEAARRSAAQRVRSKGKLALPGCDPCLNVCDAAGQFGGRRTNPEARREGEDGISVCCAHATRVCAPRQE